MADNKEQPRPQQKPQPKPGNYVEKHDRGGRVSSRHGSRTAPTASTLKPALRTCPTDLPYNGAKV
jgi:hypothetical protein